MNSRRGDAECKRSQQEGAKQDPVQDLGGQYLFLSTTRYCSVSERVHGMFSRVTSCYATAICFVAIVALLNQAALWSRTTFPRGMPAVVRLESSTLSTQPRETVESPPTPKPTPIPWCVAGEIDWQTPVNLGRNGCKPKIKANLDPVTKRCPRETFQGTAASFVGQSREDRAILNRYFCAKRNGTYLEVGALDGLKYSNTIFLEKAMGWTGVLVEAQPQSVELLRKNRPGNFIIGKAVCGRGSNGTVEFLGGKKHTRGGIVNMLRPEARQGYTSRKNMAYRVPCEPLDSMLASAGFGRGEKYVIDFASIDVEGAEQIVMETMDYRIAVRVWLIELFTEDIESKKKAVRVEQLLQAHGYRRSQWDVRNYCQQLDPTGPLRREMTGRLCTENVMFEHPALIAS